MNARNVGSNPHEQHESGSFSQAELILSLSRGPDGARTENSPRTGITSSFLHGFELVGLGKLVDI